MVDRNQTASELSLEELERIDREVTKLHQAWDNRFDLAQPRYLDRYLSDHINVRLHVNLEGVNAKSSNFCAILGRPRHGSLRRGGRNSHINWMIFGKSDLVGKTNSVSREQQDAMLIDIIKHVEDVKRGDTWSTGSVRLQSLDNSLSTARDPLYLSILNRRFEFVGINANGKANAISGWRAMSCSCESPNQVIKTGSQLMDNFADRYRDLRRRLDDAGVVGYYHKLFCVRIAITNHFVLADVGGDVAVDGKFDLCDVLVGPLNLGTTSV
jgi:hypothetical protein